MATLFSKSRLKTLAQNVSTADILPFLQILRPWQEDYHHGSLKHDKETSREQAYNNDVFVRILGYAQKPNNPFTFEPKASPTIKGQLPDAVISYNGENVFAVVELKGAAIELDRPQQREGNMSPVQQAFKYKIQYRHCPFVIVSNFYEFRLYQDNQLDYEQWTLDDLLNPAEDYLAFKTWYILLKSENFVTPTGPSKTEQLLSSVRLDQEQISKKFYSEYKEARLGLLRDLYRRNESVKKDIDFGIEKAQKIVDRLVFVCFAEDRGLLPENILFQVEQAAKQSVFGGSLWNALKGFFEAIDKGSAKLDIPQGYNGGLFKSDPALNMLEISDNALTPILELGKYDFEEEVSVSILGHIFEQSISDLEEIKRKVHTDLTVDSKRKKDGIFYTPDYIVHYIVDNSLGSYLRYHENKFKQEFGLKEDIQSANYAKRERDAYNKYLTFLQNIKVLDPACGSGAFLVYVFDYLLAEYKRVGAILNDMFSTDELIRDILSNNIFGVDLNAESVEITKLSLWLKTAQKGKKLTSLDANIKCGNSLIDDPTIAGVKAFNWQKEFPEIFAQGGFDVIVGNPPYVRQELIQPYIPALQKYKVFSGKSDLYTYFYELAGNLLKENGFIGFICSGKFFEAGYGKPLVDYLSNHFKFDKIVNFDDLEVFDGVSAYPLIFIANKEHNENYDFNYCYVPDCKFEKLSNIVFHLPYETINIKDFKNNKNKFYDKRTTQLFNKINKEHIYLKDINCLPLVGVKTGFNDGFLTTKTTNEIIKPYIFGKNIKKYGAVVAEYNIVFPYKKIDNEYKLREETFNEIEILNVYRSNLEKRAIIKDGLKSGVKKWYEYQQINKKIDFDNEYIIYPNVSLGSNFTLSRGNVIDMTGFIIPTNNRNLLAILNSKLTTFIMRKIAITRRGGYQEFKVQYLEQIPLPKDLDDKRLTELANKMLSLNEDLQKKINRFIGRVKETYNIDKITSNIANFYNLSFADFTKELAKQKIKLSMAQKDELEDYFNEYVKDISSLNEEINKTDKEINTSVYKLYNLTPQEIQLVESRS